MYFGPAQKNTRKSGKIYWVIFRVDPTKLVPTPLFTVVKRSLQNCGTIILNVFLISQETWHSVPSGSRSPSSDKRSGDCSRVGLGGWAWPRHPTSPSSAFHFERLPQAPSGVCSGCPATQTDAGSLPAGFFAHPPGAHRPPVAPGGEISAAGAVGRAGPRPQHHRKRLGPHDQPPGPTPARPAHLSRPTLAPRARSLAGGCHGCLLSDPGWLDSVQTEGGGGGGWPVEWILRRVANDAEVASAVVRSQWRAVGSEESG